MKNIVLSRNIRNPLNLRSWCTWQKTSGLPAQQRRNLFEFRVLQSTESSGVPVVSCGRSAFWTIYLFVHQHQAPAHLAHAWLDAWRGLALSLAPRPLSSRIVTVQGRRSNKPSRSTPSTATALILLSSSPFLLNGMGRKGGVNTKVEAANQKKAANKAVKDAAAAAKAEEAAAADWSRGANNRGAARKEAAATKADEAARKRREKEALLAEEEAGAGPSKASKGVGAGMKAKKSKNKKKSDLDLLEDALVGDAEKKTRQQKKAAKERKEREEKARLEKERKAREESSANSDPLLTNTDDMLRNADLAGRSANLASAEATDASGIDGALLALSVGGDGADDEHPEKRMKALHRAFEERMMPEMKRDFPGLRKTQYQEKIFQLWKKSPENPMNRPNA